MTDSHDCSDETHYIWCPARCDLGERDDGNTRWDCDTCAGMGFVPAHPRKEQST